MIAVGWSSNWCLLLRRDETDETKNSISRYDALARGIDYSAPAQISFETIQGPHKFLRFRHPIYS
jgi:hypothetical protein